MTHLCEIKSVSFYRNTNTFAVYFVARKVGESELFSAKILLEELPSCLLDPYLDFTLGGTIGTHKITERVGKNLQSKEIDRYQLVSIRNYQRTESYSDQNAPISREDSG